MERPSHDDLLRSIPSVDKLLADPALSSLKQRYAEQLVKRMVRRGLEDLRAEIRGGTAGREDCSVEAVAGRVSLLLERRLAGKLRPVINATGVIVHTNLGRN